LIDEGVKGIESEGLEEEALHDHIGHWVEVLDRWVKNLDRGMGRDGVDAASEPAEEDVFADS
jgi:hypothetical protein